MLYKLFGNCLVFTALSLMTVSCNTLDEAYDEGGSGAGRTIIADNGAVQIAGTDGLEVNGTTTTKVLTITGGADIAEPFVISSIGSTTPGQVVVIDDETLGSLKLSERSYDTRVAGVISGAGGIRPGLTLVQGSMKESTQFVALSGVVYVLADASNGPIRPGDLLTTSNTQGYAMRVTDFQKAQGAVLGKAMSSLSEKQGLVLVLVSLL